jgi:hypothetical protein
MLAGFFFLFMAFNTAQVGTVVVVDGFRSQSAEQHHPSKS